MDIWFTSDWHLGHEKIISLCKRPFESVEEMDTTIIDNFNAAVKDGDWVYFLGDFSFKSRGAYIDRMKRGFDNFILGNHDKEVVPRRLADHVDHYLQRCLLEDDLSTFTVLCHYPLEDWNGRYKGSLHLHGHCHGQLPANRLKDVRQNTARRIQHGGIRKGDLAIANRFDVSVECTNYRPLHLDEILARRRNLSE